MREAIQLDLFESDEMVIMRHDIRKIRESTEKVRKSLFAKNNELKKDYMDLAERLAILEHNICRGQNGKV